MRQIFQTLPWVHAAEPDFLVALYHELGVRGHVRKGQALKLSGQSPKLFYLERGLCAYLIAQPHKEQPSVLSLIVPGRTMGDLTCMTGDTVNVVSVAWQSSIVWEVDVPALYARLMACPEQMLALTRHLLRKQESHLEAMVANFTLPAPMRIKVFLRVLIARYGLALKPEGTVVPLLLSNAQIGLVVHLSRVSVSRILSQWQQVGLVQKRGRTLVVCAALFDDIHDWMAAAHTSP